MRRSQKIFLIYYDLFRKYQSDYQIDSILNGTSGEDILFRAKHAPMDERLSFLGLLFDAITSVLKEVCQMEDALDGLMQVLKEIRKEILEKPGITEQLEQKIRRKWKHWRGDERHLRFRENKIDACKGSLTATCKIIKCS